MGVFLGCVFFFGFVVYFGSKVDWKCKDLFWEIDCFWCLCQKNWYDFESFQCQGGVNIGFEEEVFVRRVWFLFEGFVFVVLCWRFWRFVRVQIFLG